VHVTGVRKLRTANRACRKFAARFKHGAPAELRAGCRREQNPALQVDKLTAAARSCAVRARPTGHTAPDTPAVPVTAPRQPPGPGRIVCAQLRCVNAMPSHDAPAPRPLPVRSACPALVH